MGVCACVCRTHDEVMRRDAANNFAPDAPDNYAPLGAERQSRSFDVLLRQSVRHSISIMKRVYDECVSVSIGGQCTSAALIGGPGSRCLPLSRNNHARLHACYRFRLCQTTTAAGSSGGDGRTGVCVVFTSFIRKWLSAFVMQMHS